MKKLIIVLLLSLGITAAAQQKKVLKKAARPAVKNLTVGDQVPDILIPRLINYKSKSAKLSDFKCDLMIIDFWSINCSGCVAGLPKMKALQDKFGDSIKILPVTFDPEKTTVDFWKTNRYTKGLDLLSVVGDKTFEAYFKHLGIPHEIWIYKDTVVAITFADYVTEDNIRAILQGKRVNWPIKNDFITPIDYNKPFLHIDNRQYTDTVGPVKYAAVFGYREQDIAGKNGVHKDTVRHTIRSYFVNDLVLSAYERCWQELRDPEMENFEADHPLITRCILEVKNPMDYAEIEQSGEYLNVWHRKHLFCYEAVSPDTGQTREQLARADLANLDYLLGLHGRFETRKVKCLVLVKTGGDAKLTTSGGYGKTAYENGKVVLKNAELASLLYQMNKYVGNPPVFDETKFKGHVDMDLDATSWTDIAGIRASLQNYGLDLKEEERELEMFVLTATR